MIIDDIDGLFAIRQEWKNCDPTPQASTASFHQMIFSESLNWNRFTKTASFDDDLSSTARKTQSLTLHGSDKIRPMKIDASAQAKITVEWGGTDGTKVSAEGSAKFQDDHGNYVSADVKQDSDGNGSSSISAGYEKSIENDASSKDK